MGARPSPRGRRVRIRTKLAAALSVPLTALLLVAVFEVRATAADAAHVRREAALAESSLGPSSITTAMYAERAFAAAYTVGMETAFTLEVSSNAEARAQTDEVVERFTADLERRGPRLREAYAPALASLDGLDEARAAVDRVDDAARSLGNTDAAADVFERYSAIVDTLVDAQAEVTSAITDETLRNGATLLELGNRQTDLLARLVRNLLIPAVVEDARLSTPDEIRPVATDLAEVEDNADAMRARARGEYAPMIERLFATDHVAAFPTFVRDAMASGRVDVGAVGPTSTGTEPNAFGYVVFRNEVADLLTEEAADVRSAADTRQRTFLTLAGLLSLVAVAATTLAARSITRPLAALTEQARTMARRRLPEAVRDVLAAPLGDDAVVPVVDPIEVTSRDEVGDVARALNDVQATALSLAVEQGVLRRNLADAFVSLGRRNQNLVSRQLDFVTSLEAQETDPDTLDALFRLDHLATRIRRNAESLLVLAGLETPRRWATPQRLGDVVRSAIGEVADYTRVRAVELPPATVQGFAAADIAHLIAELLDNGLRASAASWRGVEVRGRYQSDGGYLLAIVDNGEGMDADEMALANVRLNGSESYTVAPSRYLGHYVVGRLAARHGIRTQLAPTYGGGVTALVELPPTVASIEPVHLRPSVGV